MEISFQAWAYLWKLQKLNKGSNHFLSLFKEEIYYKKYKIKDNLVE